MLYVQRMIKNVQGEGYPFSVPALAAAKEIRFTAPITVICGDNGSGKSTLLSLLAAKLGAVRIGQGIIERERAAEQAQDAFTLQKQAARRSFFFSAEDFIAYIAWVSRRARFLLKSSTPWRWIFWRARPIASLFWLRIRPFWRPCRARRFWRLRRGAFCPANMRNWKISNS